MTKFSLYQIGEDRIILKQELTRASTSMRFEVRRDKVTAGSVFSLKGSDCVAVVIVDSSFSNPNNKVNDDHRL